MRRRRKRLGSRVELALLIAATACRTSIPVPDREPERRPPRVPASLPTFSEQNGAFVQHESLVLAEALRRTPKLTCDVLRERLGVDLYGKPMSLECPRGRLCGSDGQCHELAHALSTLHLPVRLLTLPNAPNRFIVLEPMLRYVGNDPEVAIANQEEGGALVRILCDDADDACTWTIARHAGIITGRVVRDSGDWRVVAP